MQLGGPQRRGHGVAVLVLLGMGVVVCEQVDPHAVGNAEALEAVAMHGLELAIVDDDVVDAPVPDGVPARGRCQRLEHEGLLTLLGVDARRLARATHVRARVDGNHDVADELPQLRGELLVVARERRVMVVGRLGEKEAIVEPVLAQAVLQRDLRGEHGVEVGCEFSIGARALVGGRSRLEHVAYARRQFLLQYLVVEHAAPHCESVGLLNNSRAVRSAL